MRDGDWFSRAVPHINVETGTIFNPPNLNGWDNVPLRDILEKELRVPVSIENVANAAALGE